MNKRDAEYADIPLLEEDTQRATARLGKPLVLTPNDWAYGLLPDPFENKCLESETAPSPF